MHPFIFVLAGVNGAGKSSVGGTFLRDYGLDWFNPDTYARAVVEKLGVTQEEANARAWAYGKASLESTIANGTSFAFETTLGGTTITNLLRAACDTHEVVILYCGLSSPELHIARVAQRVSRGGHHIPEQKIRERWSSSRANLIKLMPHVASLQVFDNSSSVAVGKAVPDPLLLLDVVHRELVSPEPQDKASLATTPEWARPIVEAAIQQFGKE